MSQVVDENSDGRHNDRFVALMERLVKLWEVLGSTPGEQVGVLLEVLGFAPLNESFLEW